MCGGVCVRCVCEVCVCVGGGGVRCVCEVCVCGGGFRGGAGGGSRASLS